MARSDAFRRSKKTSNRCGQDGLFWQQSDCGAPRGTCGISNFEAPSTLLAAV